MGFRIHRGIFQKLNAERTAYENTFKIDDDGRIKEVDSEGNVTAGYLKVGEQASDADTVDGIHAGSFLRSDASDTYTGGNLVINSSGQYRVFHAKATRAAGLGTGSAGSNTPPFLFENAGGDQAWGVVAEFRINEDNRGGDSPAILFSDAQQSTQWTVGFDYTGSEFGIRKNRGIYSGGWGTSYFKINTSGKVFIPGELEVDSRVYADNGLHVRGDWLRVDGQNGIYFESYGGGWRMTDTSWIRAYNDKNIYTGGNIEVGGTIRANGNGFYVDSTNVINSAGKFVGNIDNSETKSDYFIQEAHGNPRNNLGSPTVTEMALFDSQFRCMTDLSNNYTNLDRLTFWVQQDEGGPWEEVTTYSDTDKKKFLRTNNSGVVIPNRAYKFRVEFKAPGYVFANALYFYWSSNSHSTKVHVYKYNASQDTWHAHATSNNNVSSWPGHLYLPFSTIPWHETHTTSTGHHRYIRVEFIPNWSTGNYADRDINLYGGQIWGGYPSGRRTVHSIDHDGKYFFPNVMYLEGQGSSNKQVVTRDWVTWSNLAGKPSTFAPSSHNHDDRYYTETESDARFLGISAKAADANLLDGINSTSFLRSDANDTFTGTITMGKQHALVANNYGRGVYGTYDSRRYQHVWSMGTAYNLADDGTTAGNLYGIAWTHQNIGGESISGLGHQMLIMSNGDTRSAIGDGIWTKYNIYASGGNSTNWNTAYGWGNHATAGYLDAVPEEYKTQTQNDARYAAIAHNHSGVYDPAGTAQSVSDELSPRITAVETSTARNATDLATKANISGSYNQDFNADDMYVDQWFRNTVSGKGLYNQATTQHWYSDHDDYWNIAGGSSANGIRFRDEHGGTVRGYVYATNNNEVGFLDAGASWAIRHTNDWGTRFYTDGSTEEFRVGRDAVTGNYGTVETKTTRSSWGGYSINGRVVFMHDHGNWWGIYNDVNNEWMIRGELNGRVELRHNSATKLETTSSGVTVTGTVTATSFAGDGSALTGLPAQTPPVQATVEGGEASTLASIHFAPGEGAATFTLADGQSFRLAFGR